MGIKETKIGVLIEYLRWAEMIFIRRDPVTGREELYAPDPRSKNWKFFQKVQLCDFAAVEAVLALPTQLTLFPPEQLIEQLAAAVCEDAVQKLTKMVSSAHRNGQLVHLFGDALHHSGDGAHQNGEFGEIILAASVATEARCRRCSKTLKNGEIVVSEVGDDLFCSSRCETEHALGTPPAINGLIHKFSQERTDELIQGARTQPLPKEAAGYKWLPRDERNFIWKQIRELKVLSLPGSEFHFGRFWRSAVNMIGATPQGCDDLKHALGDLREYINNPGLDPKETAGMKFKWILSDVYGWNATDGPDGYKLWIKGAPGQKSRFAKRSESNQ